MFRNDLLAQRKIQLALPPKTMWWCGFIAWRQSPERWIFSSLCQYREVEECDCMIPSNDALLSDYWLDCEIGGGEDGL